MTWTWLVMAALAGEPFVLDSPGLPMAAGDFDGDGFDDLVFMAGDEVAVRLGDPAGLSTTDHFALDSGPNFEPYLTGLGVGDLNADGFDDLVLSSDRGERILLFLGSLTGLPSVPSQVIDDPETTDHRVTLSVVPDMTGNGYPDVFMHAGTEARRVAGSAAGLDTTIERGVYVVEENNPVQLSTADVNSDGLADVMVSHNDHRLAWLLLGGPPLADAVAGAQQFDFDVSFNGLPAVVSDLDGDGFDDALVSDDDGVIRILPGTATGLDPAWDPATATTLDLPPATVIERHDRIERIGYARPRSADVDGDGVADLLISYTGAADGEVNEGLVALYPVQAGAVAQTPTWWVTGNAVLAILEVRAVADTDGDGSDELWMLRNPDTLVVPVGATGLPPAFPMLGVAEERVEERYFGFDIVGSDVDGDGFSDVMVSAFKPRPPVGWAEAGGVDEGEVTLWPGGPTGVLPTVPTHRWTSTGGFGRQLNNMGDLDGDGLPDIVAAGADAYGPATYGYYYWRADFLWSGVKVLFGATGGELDLTSPSFAGFGRQAVSAGDLNGDGVPELVMTMDDRGLGLWFGQPGGTYAAAPDQEFLIDAPLRWTSDLVASVGDVDGDGLDDIAVGMIANSYFGDPEPGGLRVYFGNPAGLVAAYQEIDPPAARSSFGVTVDAAGDVNADGYDDVWVGTLEDGAHLYFGGPGGLSATPDWSVPAIEAAPHGYQVRSAGDVDGDGFVDALVRPIDHLGRMGDEFGTPLYGGFEPIRLFLGSAAGPVAPAAWSAPALWGSGHTAVGVGDVDGDGLDDVALGGNQRLWLVTGAEIFGPPVVPGDTGDTGLPAETGDTGSVTGGTPTGDTGTVDPTDTDQPDTTQPPASEEDDGKGCGCQATGDTSGSWEWFGRRRAR